MRKKLLLTILVISFISTPHILQAKDDNGKYIKEIFRSKISELPMMAWIVYPDSVFSEEKADRLFVYSGSVFEVIFDKICLDSEIQDIREKYHIACNVKEKLYQYKIPDPSSISESLDRAFFSTKSFPTQIKSGRIPFEMDNLFTEKIFKLSEISQKVHLHKMFAIKTKGAKYIYSLHGLYDPESKELYRDGIILQDPNGDILAKRFWDISWDTVCDGCDLPLYSNSHPDYPELDMIGLFNIINAFSISDFKYPVLMLDTSTVEGRAISLITFTDKTEYSEYRVYEYIVNCFH